MQEIMEHYGMALLGVVEVLGAYGILLSVLADEGAIYRLVVYFLQNICG